MLTDPLNLSDQPLNLEQDQSVQGGRMSTSQREFSRESSLQIDFRPAPPPCGHQQRELHQCDFQPWME